MKKLVLTETQYKKLQNVIVETSLLNEQSKNQIKEVQRRLKECFGAYLGTTGPRKDGIDGVCGPLTKEAIEKYTSYRFDGKTKDNPNSDQDNLEKWNPVVGGSDMSDLLATT